MGRKNFWILLIMLLAGGIAHDEQELIDILKESVYGT